MNYTSKSKYLLIDMSSLRFQRSVDKKSIQASFIDNSPLINIEVDETSSDQESVFLLFEELLTKDNISFEGGTYPVALYNPFTFQVAVNPTPDTEIYTNNSSLEIKENGELADLKSGKIIFNQQTLNKINPNYAQVLEDIISNLN